MDDYFKQKVCEDFKWEPRKWGMNMIYVRSLEEDIFLYAKKNLAVVNVYIKDPVVTRIMKDQVRDLAIGTLMKAFLLQ